ncbi:MAG: hypothetical protein MJZ41_15750 [Bacteroidaceae bacterium]|nr:hypothetical protein [Bacteroidaceae bacterium]
MKVRNIVIAAIVALFAGINANAAEVEATATSESASVITVKTSKVSKELVEAWANAYMQQNTHVKVQIVGKNVKDADLTFVSDAKGGDNVTFVGRYAILPVTSSHNPLISELQKKDWSKNDLKKLYFSSLDEDLDDEDEANSGKAGKLREKFTVYSSANSTSASRVFAQHFGYQVSEIRGNKISGDDLYLLNAIEEDKQSITFNNVAYLYDTNTRTLKSDIAILPLNLKSEQEKVLQNGNLDETIKLLEAEKSDLIPVENFGFTYNELNQKAQLFLEWIVSDGQQYNNKNGFLRLADKDVQQQLKILAAM